MRTDRGVLFRYICVQAGITAESLGSAEFKQDYHLTYAYLAGGMYRGIASKEMVVKLSRAGMMGFFKEPHHSRS